MSILSDYHRDRINAAITDGMNGKLNILYGQKMGAIKCPKCGSPCAHCKIKDLSSEETGTRNGGYLIEFEYECTCCKPFQIVIAEHKGTCVVGQIVGANLDYVTDDTVEDRINSYLLIAKKYRNKHQKNKIGEKK